MAVKNFVLMKENTCRSNLISQNYTSYYQLTVPESNRLNTPVIFAWLSIKAISKQQNGKKHEQDEAEQQNVGAGSCLGVLCALLSSILLFPTNRSFLSYKNSHFQKKAKCETFLV